MRSRAELIRSLAEDLRPVRALAPGGLATLWLAGSWALVAGVGLASGPLRPGVGAQLASQPRFLLESLLGLLVGIASIRTVARLAVPSTPVLRAVVPPLLLLIAWAGAYASGLIGPSFEASMLGKRAHCEREILLLAAVPLGAGLWVARRGAPLARSWTGAGAGSAAAALPALFMQFACMYEPAHLVAFHLLPIVVLAGVGALLGPLALRRI